MKCVRKRISCRRFNKLLWQFIKVGHTERNLFCAASEGILQGGALFPILLNIKLIKHENT
jgi:RNA-directed DNA polymerase